MGGSAVVMAANDGQARRQRALEFHSRVPADVRERHKAEIAFAGMGRFAKRLVPQQTLDRGV